MMPCSTSASILLQITKLNQRKNYRGCSKESGMLPDHVQLAQIKSSFTYSSIQTRIIYICVMGLIERDKKFIWHPFTPQKNMPEPLAIVKGEGTLLIDEHGKSYIDAISS